MNALEQRRAREDATPACAVPAAEAIGDDLLGLPPGITAAASTAAASPAGDASPALAPGQPIEWYHLDPDENYQELRLGEGPGLWRGLAFGGILSALAIGLFYACMWFLEPSAMLLNPFVDRSYSESRDEMVMHLGGLSPLAAKWMSKPASATQPAVTEQFTVVDLRAASRPSANGALNGGQTWYRFDLPREQVAAYRAHLVNTWLARLKHRVDDGRNDAAFESGGAPEWWDAKEFDPDTRLRLVQSDGAPAFHAAFSLSRGRVYIRVNH